MVSYQLAIKLAKHKRILSALNRTDSLTGLLNHGAWKDCCNCNSSAAACKTIRP
ncbi:diguanylate cyclase AdrA [compost metagenome]